MPRNLSSRSFLPMLCTAALCLTGCGHATTPAGATPPAASTEEAAPPVPMPELDGRWVLGTGDEPAAGPVSGCAPANSITWAQVGSHVGARVQTCVNNCYVEETLQGRIDGQNVTLTGFAAPPPGVGAAAQPISYTLAWDPATGHLRGERDGQPIWIAPYMPTSGAYCGPASK